MTAEIRLPRLLADSVKLGLRQLVDGDTMGDALDDLFGREPAVRNHILDESGEIRAHVSVFVDGTQADLDTTVPDGAKIRVLHAVSGG